MKRFIVCIWFGLVFSFLYGATVSFDDMRERIAYDPLGSLASLDSLETDSTYFSYQIDYLRALSYQTQSQYYMSVYYVRRAFETDGMQRDSILLPYAYMLWAKSSIMSFQLKEAAKVIAAGKSYALKCHNLGLQANMLQMEGTFTVKWEFCLRVMNASQRLWRCFRLPGHRTIISCFPTVWVT